MLTIKICWDALLCWDEAVHFGRISNSGSQLDLFSQTFGWKTLSASSYWSLFITIHIVSREIHGKMFIHCVLFKQYDMYGYLEKFNADWWFSGFGSSYSDFKFLLKRVGLVLPYGMMKVFKKILVSLFFTFGNCQWHDASNNAPAPANTGTPRTKCTDTGKSQ